MQLHEALGCAENQQSGALEELQQLGLANIPPEKRSLVGELFYERAKVLLSKAELQSALQALRSACLLDPVNLRFEERARLLQEAILTQNTFGNRTHRDGLQCDLGLFCVRSRCQCEGLFRIATCRGAVEESFVHMRRVGNMAVYTVGPYYAHRPRGKWTGYLKQVKRQFKRELLEPLAEVMASFVLYDTPLMASVDVLVPVPPSPVKLTERGFAPNDILAEYLGRRLALPVYNVLLRTEGTPTRAASRQQLASQFQTRPVCGRRLKGLSLLLVEDIWTSGRTIAICAENLRSYAPKELSVVALGKTA